MRFKELSENTVAGSIASVAMPLGGTQKRNKPEKAPKVAKGKKYGNVISEGKMKELAYDLQHLNHGNFVKKYGKEKEYFRKKLGNEPVSEAELSEQDLIVVPGMRKSKDTSFIPHDKDRRDHEVEMARNELYAAAKDAMRIYKMIKDRSEDQGLMGWQQSYITLAADYLNSVADSLEHHQTTEGAGVIAGGMSNFEEGLEDEPPPEKGSLEYRALKRMKGPTQEDALEALAIELGLDKFKRDNRVYSEYIPALVHHYKKQNKINEISDFKRKELEWELRNEPKNNYQVSIDGRAWKVFADKAHAEAVARKLRAKGKKAEVHLTGASVSEEKLDEKKDACYSKVKSRYKVWPSAYASGALVKCRKVGASNWGNKSKK